MYFAFSKSRKRAKIRISGVSNISDHIQIKIRVPNPSQEPQAPPKAQNQDLKGQNLDHRWCKDQWPHPNQDKDSKPKSGASSVLKCLKAVLKGHVC